jgi:hypothetical protein
MAAAETFLVTVAAREVTGGALLWAGIAVTVFAFYRGHTGLYRVAHREALKRVHEIALAFGCVAVAWAALLVIFVALERLNAGDGITASPLLGVGLAGTSILVAYSFTIARQRLKIDHRDIMCARLPDGLNGLTVAHLSDFHVGGFRPLEWLERIVERVNKLRPDIVVITGDLANHGDANTRDAIAALSLLETRLGCYVVLGNHDVRMSGTTDRMSAESETPASRCLKTMSKH